LILQFSFFQNEINQIPNNKTQIPNKFQNTMNQISKMSGSLEIRISIWPFDLVEGGESFDFAKDREPVERHVEPSVIC